MLKSFKYILCEKCLKKEKKKKIRQEKKELCQNDLIFIKNFDLYQVSKWLKIHKDFWIISSGKMFQYSQIVYKVLLITQ